VLAAVFALLLIMCAYAGKISPSRFFLAPFLTLGYMPMLMLLPVVLLIILLLRRWLSVLLLVIAFVVTLPVFGVYVPFNDDEDLPAMPADPQSMLKVMTYNVLAFNYVSPPESDSSSPSIALILKADPDVVVLQEGGAAGVQWSDIPSIQPYLEQVKARYPYSYNSPEGLNLLSKFPFTTQALGAPCHVRSTLGYNRDNRSYLARAYDLQLPSGKQVRLIDFRLQSYHLQFGQSVSVRISPDIKPSPLDRMRRAFTLRASDAAAIRQAIDNSPGNVIVCGDMNDVPTSNVYRTICGEDMSDAWVEVGNGYAYTFNKHRLNFRIDHILYRGKLEALNARRLVGGSSDHYPLMVSFNTDIATVHKN